MLYTGFCHEGPASVRYPRGQGPGATINENMEALPLGKAEIKRQGKKFAILAFGSMVYPAIEVAESFDATAVNMRFVKPLDEKLILDLTANHDFFVTIEENAAIGGAGSAINEFLQRERCSIPVLNLGLPDHFVEQGSREECLAECGLNIQGISDSIEGYISRKTAKQA